MAEGNFNWGMVAAFVPQEEAARSAQTQRGNRRVGSQFWFVVAVPAHAVAAVAVLIEQDAVEGTVGGGFEPRLEV